MHQFSVFAITAGLVVLVALLLGVLFFPVAA
jgi:hypothetical protein